MSDKPTAHKKPFDPTHDNYSDTYVEKLVFDSPWVRLAAVATSISSGLVAGIRTIHKQFYDENKKKAPYKEDYWDRRDKHDANGAALKEKKIDKQQYKVAAKEIEADWRACFEETNVLRGINTTGVGKWTTGTLQKAATLNPGDATRIGLNTLGAMAITLGVFMGVRQMSRYRHMLTQIDDKLDRLTYDLDNNPHRPSGTERIEEIEAHRAAHMEALAAKLETKEAAQAATATRT